MCRCLYLHTVAQLFKGTHVVVYRSDSLYKTRVCNSIVGVTVSHCSVFLHSLTCVAVNSSCLRVSWRPPWCLQLMGQSSLKSALVWRVGLSYYVAVFLVTSFPFLYIFLSLLFCLNLPLFCLISSPSSCHPSVHLSLLLAFLFLPTVPFLTLFPHYSLLPSFLFIRKLWKQTGPVSPSFVINHSPHERRVWRFLLLLLTVGQHKAMCVGWQSLGGHRIQARQLEHSHPFVWTSGQ